MKFLIITQYFPPEVGAAQTRLAATSRSLQQLGHSVEVVTAMPNYPHGVVASEYQGHFYHHEIPIGRLLLPLHYIILVISLSDGS